MENTKEILNDPKFIEQKGVRSIVDQDARVGHKSKTEIFFGIKLNICLGYYGKSVYPENSMDCRDILRMFSDDLRIAIERFKEFNERKNNDQCLEDQPYKRGFSDEEARLEIKKLLGAIEIPQVKSLPKVKRKEVLRKVKEIDGLSLRQAARILGISLNLIFKA